MLVFAGVPDCPGTPAGLIKLSSTKRACDFIAGYLSSTSIYIFSSI